MPTLLIILLIVFSSFNCSTINSIDESNTYIRIYENGRFGYIDNLGNYKIKPQFRSASNFNDGMACVRKEGLFGYIDHSGEWIIEPKYDYGVSFTQNSAIVWENGKPSLINKNGLQIYSAADGVQITSAGNNLYFISNGSDYGIIDSKGKTIIDLKYNSIATFIDGYAVIGSKYIDSIFEENEDVYTDISWKFGVIDSTGKEVITPNKYVEIFNLGKGRFNCSSENDNVLTSSILDYKGTQYFQFSDSSTDYSIADENDICDNRIPFTYFKRIPNKIGYSIEIEEGYMNNYGDIVISTILFKEVFPFKNGVAIVKDKQDFYHLIDTIGNVISKVKYKKIIDEKFFNGNAIVFDEFNEWKIIDQNEKIFYKYPFKDILFNEVLNNKYIVGEGDNSDGRFNILMDFKGRILVRSSGNQEFYGSINQDIIYTIRNNSQEIINHKGSIIWKDTSHYQPTYDNIDFKHIADYPVSSARHKTDVSGFAKADNQPIKITNAIYPKGVSLSISNIDVVKNVILIKVSNNSDSAKFFDVINSRLYLCMQAKDKDGKWKDIERYSRSWCGNSYHIVKLESKEYWQLEAPIFNGCFKTKLRFKLLALEKEPERGNGIPKLNEIYSSEIDGKINPAKFWREQIYYSTNIMDAVY